MAWRIGSVGRRPLAVIVLIAVVGIGIAGSVVGSPPDDRVAPAITDEQGRTLTLRGFSTAGSAKGTDDGLPTIEPEDIDTEYRDMGTNFVRFLISWRAVEPEPGEYDSDYLDQVAKRVRWYQERGYHVMLDMHQDLYGNQIIPGSGVGNGAPGWATHTDGKSIDAQEQWEFYYLEPGVIRAFDNFWNTTGKHPELREHYVGAWKAVAERFSDSHEIGRAPCRETPIQCIEEQTQEEEKGSTRQAV